MSSTGVLYPIRPLECFARMKELRRQIAWDTWLSKERGKPLAMAGEAGCSAILGAFDAEIIPTMPTGREMRNTDWVVKLNEAAEARGYNQDCCSTLRIALGAQFLGTYGVVPNRQERIKPDFVFSMVLCQGQIKSHQAYADNLGMPTIHIELPYSHPRPEEFQGYFLDQCHNAIEHLEKLLGRKCDDEKLVEGVKNEWRSRILMARVAELQQTVPAPLRLKNYISFGVFQWRGMNHRSDVVAFYQLALEETRQRVADGIAGTANERLRLIHEGTLPWYKSPIINYPDRHGAPYIGSFTHFTNFGCFFVNDQGHWEIPQAPWERGMEIKDRESALKALADLYLNYFLNIFVMERPEIRLAMARDWKIDGGVFALDRGCIGVTTMQLENVLVFKQAGIPAVSYELSCTNPADTDEGAYQQMIDLFVESLEPRH